MSTFLEEVSKLFFKICCHTHLPVSYTHLDVYKRQPKSKTSLTFRNAVLSLAREHAFARALVNSGRLSVPCILSGSRLNTPDDAPFTGDMVPGAPMDDAPMAEAGQPRWLLEQLGNRFVALLYVNDPAEVNVAQLAQFQACLLYTSRCV